MNTLSSRVATRILDGWRLSDRLRDKIFYATAALYRQSGKRPGLAVIHVGNALEMERYVYAKKQLAFSLGINFSEYNFPENTTTTEIKNCITFLNSNTDVNGIIVQLPLPKHLMSTSILNSILPIKDADGCHSLNQGLLHSDESYLESSIPCAAMAMSHFLQISYR